MSLLGAVTATPQNSWCTYSPSLDKLRPSIAVATTVRRRRIVVAVVYWCGFFSMTLRAPARKRRKASPPPTKDYRRTPPERVTNKTTTKQQKNNKNPTKTSQKREHWGSNPSILCGLVRLSQPPYELGGIRIFKLRFRLTSERRTSCLHLLSFSHQQDSKSEKKNAKTYHWRT